MMSHYIQMLLHEQNSVVGLPWIKCCMQLGVAKGVWGSICGCMNFEGQMDM